MFTFVTIMDFSNFGYKLLPTIGGKQIKVCFIILFFFLCQSILLYGACYIVLFYHTLMEKSTPLLTLIHLFVYNFFFTCNLTFFQVQFSYPSPSCKLSIIFGTFFKILR